MRWLKHAFWRYFSVLILVACLSIGLTAFYFTQIVKSTESSPLKVQIQPRDVKLKVGETQVFEANVSGGVPPYHLVWQSNGTVIGYGFAVDFCFQSPAFYTILFVNVTDKVGNYAEDFTVVHDPFVPPNVYLDDLPSIAHFTVETASGYTWSTRHDGKITMNSTSANAVVNSALSSLTSGRVWKEKVVVNGNFTLSNIVVPSYTVLEFEGKVWKGANDEVFNILNVHDVDLVGLVGDGRKQTYSGGYSFVQIGGAGTTYNINLISPKISNNGYTGIAIAYNTHDIKIIDSETSNCTGAGAAQAGISVNGFLNQQGPYNVWIERPKSFLDRYGITIESATNSSPYNVWINDAYIENATEIGIHIEGISTTEAPHGIWVQNCEVVNSTKYGIEVATGSYDVWLINDKSHDNVLDGFHMEGGENIHIENPKAYNNGVVSNRQVGVSVSLDVNNNAPNRLFIDNAECYDTHSVRNDRKQNIGILLYSSIAGKQSGIFIYGGETYQNYDDGFKTQNFRYVQVLGLTSRENGQYNINVASDHEVEILGGLTDSATKMSFPIDAQNIVVHHIQGFVTENSVSFSSISNGTYVAHGLVGTPDYVQITLSVGGYAWYGTLNATHIQIHANVATISGSMYCEYKP